MHRRIGSKWLPAFTLAKNGAIDPAIPDAWRHQMVWQAEPRSFVGRGFFHPGLRGVFKFFVKGDRALNSDRDRYWKPPTETVA